MPEWLVERGIGETRAALVDAGEIVEARVELDGFVREGSVVQARLKNRGVDGRNAVAISEDGLEYLLPAGARQITEGASLAIEITREAIPGVEPWKRARARVTESGPVAALPLSERLGGRDLAFPTPRDELGDAGWVDLVDEARTGVIAFTGGELRISPTPAMTLIDVDGYLGAEELALVGAREAARSIRRLDIGGSIGIDLPTVGSKAVRQLAAQAIDSALPQPFERTAVNGFGFVQIVRPRMRASLVELAQDRATFEARVMLRRVSLEGAGGRRLVAHPAVLAVLEKQPDWLDDLSRQLGGPVSLRAEHNLTMSGGYAESV